MRIKGQDEYSAQAHTAILDGRLVAGSVARARTIRTTLPIPNSHLSDST